jgi:hypothetical protein
MSLDVKIFSMANIEYQVVDLYTDPTKKIPHYEDSLIEARDPDFPQSSPKRYGTFFRDHAMALVKIKPEINKMYPDRRRQVINNHSWKIQIIQVLFEKGFYD